MLIVVRHGRTAANAAGLLLGHADPPLDETGLAQADALAAALPRPARVVTSPLQRARETASAFNAVAEVDERWIELDYGGYDGKPVADVPAEVWAAWRADPDFAPPGGESLAALRVRVERAADELLEQARDEDVVVVTHVSPIKAAVGWALGVGPEINWRPFVQPASYTRIAHGGSGPTLRAFNVVAHLD